MKPYLIDTNILIDFLRGHEKAIEFFKELTIQPGISVLTIAELFASVKGKQEKVKIHNLVNACEIIPVNSEIAEDGGLLKNKYQKSHRIGLADALIAATAIETKLTLVTLNKKHFPMVNMVEVPY